MVDGIVPRLGCTVDSPTFTDARSRSASMTALNVATYLNATAQVRLQAGRNPHNRGIERPQNMHIHANSYDVDTFGTECWYYFLLVLDFIKLF